MLTKRGCCCGEPTGISCGQRCGACGADVYFAPGEDGTVSDATGTHALLFKGGGFWDGPDGLPQVDYGTAPIPWTTTVAHTDPDTFECIVGSGTVYYGWAISCLTSDGVNWAMFVWFTRIEGIRCGPSEDCIVYYRQVSGPPPGWDDISLLLQGDGDATCDGSTLTSVSSGWVRPDYDPPANMCHNANPWPSETATFSIPLETPRDQACCKPCPIPQEGITLSWGGGTMGAGSAPFVYDPADGRWKVTVVMHFDRASEPCVDLPVDFVLECRRSFPEDPGQIGFSASWACTDSEGGIVGLSCDDLCNNLACLHLADWTCGPLHLHYQTNNFYPANYCWAFLRGIGPDFYITDFYIDGP